MNANAAAVTDQATDPATEAPAETEKKKRVKKVYAPLDLKSIVASAKRADPAEAAKLAPVTYKPAERSETMLQFDAWVADMYAAWEKAGKDAKLLFTDKFPPFKVFGANEAEAEAIHVMVKGSAAFLGHGYRFGQDTPTTDSRICVSFYAIDKVARAKNGTPHIDDGSEGINLPPNQQKS